MVLPAGLKYAGLGLMPGLHSYRFALNEHRKSSPDELRSGQGSRRWDASKSTKEVG